jgi:uncharacterized membrane protein YvbJ
MVYCSKCGTLNADDAKVCIKCGAPLQGASSETAYSPYWRHRRYEGDYYHYRSGAGIGALILGVIVILIGLSVLFSQVYGFNFPFWPTILVLIGIWILYSGLRRNRRYSQSAP